MGDPNYVQIPEVPEDWRIEAMARALTEARGLDPNALIQHFTWEDWPEDGSFVNSRNERCPMHFAWRHDERYARAAYGAALRGRQMDGGHDA